MHILTSKRGVLFISDTSINSVNSADSLVDITRLTHEAVCRFSHDPVIAMLSYSNFGSRKEDVAVRTASAIKELHERYPGICVDGEMQVTYALNRELRDEVYPFTKLKGRDVNTLIFPNLSSANTAYKLMLEMGLTDAIGPIQIGLNKPIQFISVNSPVRDIMNLATVAALDAILLSKEECKTSC